jgi:hypothetical protein
MQNVTGLSQDLKPGKGPWTAEMKKDSSYMVTSFGKFIYFEVVARRHQQARTVLFLLISCYGPKKCGVQQKERTKERKEQGNNVENSGFR